MNPFKLLGLLILLLLFSSLLSACQSEPTDQMQACNQKHLPTVKRLEPAQASAQMVYVSNGSDLYALNSGNGTPRWCMTLSKGKNREHFAGLTFSHGSIYVYTDAESLVSFHAGSGTLSWSTNIGQIFVDNFTPPALVDAMVYGGTKSISALNTQDGRVRWNYPLPAAYSNSIPVAGNGGVYFSVNPTQQGASQQIYALDPMTGNRRWIFSLPTHQVIFSQLAVAEGAVVFPYENYSSDGAIHFGLEALNTRNGKLLWQKAIGGAMGGMGANQSSAAADGLFYVIGEFPDNSVNAVTSLYALDTWTGDVRWSHPLDDNAIDGSLLIANHVLYSVEPTGLLRAWDAQTGEFLWSIHVQAGILGQLFLLNDHLFLGTTGLDQDPGFFVSAISIDTHQEDWYANISGDGDNQDLSVVCVGG